MGVEVELGVEARVAHPSDRPTAGSRDRTACRGIGLGVGLGLGLGGGGRGRGRR